MWWSSGGTSQRNGMGSSSATSNDFAQEVAISFIPIGWCTNAKQIVGKVEQLELGCLGGGFLEH